MMTAKMMTTAITMAMMTMIVMMVVMRMVVILHSHGDGMTEGENSNNWHGKRKIDMEKEDLFNRPL